MKRPLISVVIPVYNIEAYIAKAIDSVVVQDVDFQSAIELILVDDGSTDKSGKICQEYVAKYPNNVQYLKQKNAGVSSARNLGFDHAKGAYVHFFDGDDILGSNFYTKIIALLENDRSIDFAAAKLMFFDEIIDSHPLNNKFETTRIIDLTMEPDNPILHVISGVFRRSTLEDVRFDETISIAEDVKFISDVLLKNPRYGVISDTTYHYRKRRDGSSAIATSRQNKTSYTDVIDGVYSHMLSAWGGSNTFPEYTVLYDLSYRLNQKDQSILSAKEEAAYVKSVFTIVSKISDQAIISTRFLSIHQKIFLLLQKHGSKFKDHISVSDGSARFNGHELYNPRTASVFLDFITPLGDDSYKVEGYINGVTDLAEVGYTAVVGGDVKKLNFVERFQREKSFLGHVYEKGGAFEVEVILPPHSALSFQVKVGEQMHTLPLHTGRYTRFGALKWTYRREDGRLLKRQSSSIESHHYRKIQHLKLELRMMAQILLNWRINTFRQRFAMLRSRNLAHLDAKAKLLEILKPFAFSVEAIAYIPRDLSLRIAYHIAKTFKKRPIWLVSDRSMAAGDNGEAMFRHIMARDDCPADVYFVMSKKSLDLARMKEIGPVIYQESLRFKLMFLLSDKVIASQADIETTNPFIRLLDRYVDLFEFDFIFLQHGIIRHNLSTWLNRFEKNIALFITSAEKEYQSIFTNPYYYEPKNVLLSGLARYDYLESEPAKKLILAPTYRKNLVKMKTDRIGRRQYDPTFKTSQYREFYNNLMNDPRLLAVLREHDMTGEFYLHPVFSAQHSDFNENEQFKLMQFPYDYRKAFRDGNLMISDHSSVVFDFAYLKKPVAYAHFDVDTFFAGHSYDESNFFSDEDDGFGEVYYDYDTLVNGVIDTIKSGSKMSKKYISRVDNFFYKVDKNNSRRTYEAIIKMNK